MMNQSSSLSPSTLNSRYLLLFLTGLGGVAFELAAVRMFAAEFGSTVQSTACVTSVFLAALALGGLVLGRIADGKESSLRLFAWITLVAGLAIGATPFVVPMLSRFALSFAPQDFGLIRWLALIPVALLGVGLPGFLLGGNVPTLVADQHSVLTRSSPGWMVGANTFGSVVGALLAGFTLLELIGTRATTFCAGGVLVVTGVAAFVSSQPLTRRTSSPEEEGDGISQRARGIRVGLSVAAFATGFATLAMEVLGTRLLMQFLASSAHAFAGVLAVFLVGSALGAIVGGSLLASRPNGLSFIPLLLGLVAMSVGLLAPALVTAGEHFPIELGRTAGGQLLLSLALFPATFFSGALYAIVLSAYPASSRAGRFVGAMTVANTLGSVIGATLGGFVLIPTVGVGYGLGIAAALPLLVALGWPARPTLGRGVGVVVGGAALALLFVVDVRVVPKDEELLVYREGPVANVIVTKRGDDPRPVLYLNRTAAQGGGSAGLIVERRQALLPLALRPDVSSALVLGVGTGGTLSAVLEAGIKRIDAVDLVAGVFDVMGRFDGSRRSPADQPWVTSFVTDAVSFVRDSATKYDLVLGDLYHPWMDGAGALYSVEHFRAVRERLTDDGLYCQWIPLHQLRWEDFGLLCRTFSRVFPRTMMFLLDARSTQPIVALIGPKGPFRIPPETLQAMFDDPRRGAPFRAVGFTSTDDLLALYLGDQLTIDATFGGDKALGDEGLLNTIDRPVIEYRAARTVESELTLGLNNLHNLTMELGGSVNDLVVHPESLDETTRQELQLKTQRRYSALRQFLAGHYWNLRRQVAPEDPQGMLDRELTLYLHGLVYDAKLGVLNDAAVRVAKEMFLDGRYTAAATASSAIVERNPENLDAARCLGLSLLLLFEFDKATLALQHAVGEVTTDAALLSELAIARYLNQQDDEARNAITRALAIAPLRVSLLARGVADAVEGRPDEARKELEPLLDDPRWGGLARRVQERLEPPQ